MLREYLKKVVVEEGHNTKKRLEETDDYEEIIDGMNELELRRYAENNMVTTTLAWKEPINVIKKWYIRYQEEK